MLGANRIHHGSCLSIAHVGRKDAARARCTNKNMQGNELKLSTSELHPVLTIGVDGRRSNGCT